MMDVNPLNGRKYKNGDIVADNEDGTCWLFGHISNDEVTKSLEALGFDTCNHVECPWTKHTYGVWSTDQWGYDYEWFYPHDHSFPNFLPVTEVNY